jgi:hypothetical protein
MNSEFKQFTEWGCEGCYVTSGNSHFRAVLRNGKCYSDSREFDPDDFCRLNEEVPCKPITEEEFQQVVRGKKKNVVAAKVVNP